MDKLGERSRFDGLSLLPSTLHSIHDVKQPIVSQALLRSRALPGIPPSLQCSRGGG
jgi:hypothetical protein